MTLKQFLSPVVMDWLTNPENSSKNFDEWFVENKDLINESVENNLDEINECIDRARDKSKYICELNIPKRNVTKKTDVSDTSSTPISGEIDVDVDVEKTPKAKVLPSTPKAKVLPSTPKAKKKLSEGTYKVINDDDENKSDNDIFIAINSVYDNLVARGIQYKENSDVWGRFDTSDVTNTKALFAFTDIENADLSKWDMSKVTCMEGMFYKSTFNNDSILKWDVSNCADFFKMFKFSNFSYDLNGFWTPKAIPTKVINEYGEEVFEDRPARCPIVGKNVSEEEEASRKYWENMIMGIFDTPKDEEKGEEDEDHTLKLESKTMKNILDYETFINEGFKENIKNFVDKSVKNISSFFKNIVIKLGNLVLKFDKNGKLVKATSPYTILNNISDGAVKGIKAYTKVKNEYINDNVKSRADIVESPEYYGIIDKDSIEYRNYLTMVDMINEHYSKYGDNELEPLNEGIDIPGFGSATAKRVGFSAKDGGISVPDITTKGLVERLKVLIDNTPGTVAKGSNPLGAMLIWGAPGIGKSTIPNALLSEWNKNKDIYNKKSVLVIECGELTVDGISIPVSTTKKFKDLVKCKPFRVNLFKKLKKYEIDEKKFESYLNTEIKGAADIVKDYLPFYKLSDDNIENIVNNDWANGQNIIEYDDEGNYNTYRSTEGGLIIFDEFFRANENIFKVIMQVILNRRISGNYVLGDKWAIIACSNRPEDDKESKKGLKSTGAVLGTRFGAGQFNFIPDFNSWQKWALDKGGFDSATIQFLRSKVNGDGENVYWHTIKPGEYIGGKTVAPTPRTWSKLMDVLNAYCRTFRYSSILDMFNSEDKEHVQMFKEQVIGTIGEETAEAYFAFLEDFDLTDMFNPKLILNDSKYIIGEDVSPQEVSYECGKYINYEYFSKDKKPSDEQLTNLITNINKAFPRKKEITQLYLYIINKLGLMSYIDEGDEDSIYNFCKNEYKNFTKEFVKKYKLGNMESDNDKEIEETIENFLNFIVDKTEKMGISLNMLE